MRITFPKSVGCLLLGISAYFISIYRCRSEADSALPIGDPPVWLCVFAGIHTQAAGGRLPCSPAGFPDGPLSHFRGDRGELPLPGTRSIAAKEASTPGARPGWLPMLVGKVPDRSSTSPGSSRPSLPLAIPEAALPSLRPEGKGCGLAPCLAIDRPRPPCRPPTRRTG